MTPANLTVMLFPWSNGGWYTALVDGDYTQLIGPCTGMDFIGLRLVMLAIYNNTISIEEVDDGEQYLVLKPGGVLRDERHEDTKEAKKYWMNRFKEARATQKDLNAQSEARLKRLQESMRKV